MEQGEKGEWMSDERVLLQQSADQGLGVEYSALHAHTHTNLSRYLASAVTIDESD